MRDVLNFKPTIKTIYTIRSIACHDTFVYYLAAHYLEFSPWIDVLVDKIS